MSIFEALLLGVVQGLTEFLPVSSSGHLVLGQNFFGITEPVLSFDITLHMGTLAAVVLVFYQDIRAMVLSLLNLVKSVAAGKASMAMIRDNRDVRLAALIIVGSVPTAFIGLFLKQHVETSLSSLSVVGLMLMGTGTFLWFTRNIRGNTITIDGFGFKKAVFIGICQGLAVIPGVSRSGATIAAGLFTGIERETAARFSFLLSLPAIVGAELLSVKESLATGFYLDKATLYGTFVSFVVGFFALKVLLKIVKNGRLHLFAPYCWAAGVLAVAAGLAG